MPPPLLTAAFSVIAEKKRNRAAFVALPMPPPPGWLGSLLARLSRTSTLTRTRTSSLRMPPPGRAGPAGRWCRAGPSATPGSSATRRRPGRPGRSRSPRPSRPGRSSALPPARRSGAAAAVRLRSPVAPASLSRPGMVSVNVWAGRLMTCGASGLTATRSACCTAARSVHWLPAAAASTSQRPSPRFGSAMSAVVLTSKVAASAGATDTSQQSSARPAARGSRCRPPMRPPPISTPDPRQVRRREGAGRTSVRRSVHLDRYRNGSIGRADQESVASAGRPSGGRREAQAATWARDLKPSFPRIRLT